MEAKDPLADLADIHLPVAVSAWPPAPLWWLLAALALAAIAAAAYMFYHRWLLRKKMQVALDEITRAHRHFQAAQHEVAAQASLALLHTCNSVLKRVALVHYPETEVAGLYGRHWLAFLDASGSTDAFSTGPAQVLADGSYRRSFQADAATANALVSTASAWISKQYVSKRHQSSVPEPAVTP